VRTTPRIGELAAVVVGAAVVVAIAVVDLVVGDSAVLLPLLVIGPLVVAVGASARWTAAVGALALAAAIPLGLVAAGTIFSTEHSIEVLAVALGAALAVLAAATRTRSEEGARTSAALLALERRERERSTFLDRASRLLEAPPEPSSMLAEIVRLAVPDMAELCIVDLLDDDGALRGEAVHSTDPVKIEAVRASRQRFPLDVAGSHPVAVAVREGTPRMMAALSTELQSQWATSPEHLDTMARQRWTSALVIPLVARGRTLGVMTFARFEDAPAYLPADLALAAEIGRRAALALDNARLFSELSRTERQLEAVLENLAEAVVVQAPDGTLVYVNQAAAQLLECSTTAEALSTPLAELLGRFIVLDEHGHPFDFARLPGRRALAGQPAPEPALMRSISHATGEERWMVTKATSVHDDHGAAALAVIIMEDVTEEHRAARQQRFLSAASMLVTSSLDIELTLDKVAWAVVPEVADWCCVDMPDERGALRRRALAIRDGQRELLDGLRVGLSMDPDDPGSLARVLRTGEPILLADLERGVDGGAPVAPAAVAALRASGTRSLVTVPMRAGDRVIGVITLATAESGRRLSADELALAEELGRRAGIAVENARLHETRTHIATTLQRSLLPQRLPVVPGLTLAARFRAAGETVEVGGDFYDLFGAGDGWMVVVGDVTGKGPTAATTTSLARYTMRTAAMYERSPAAILARLNAALVADGDRRQLCTAVCARIELGPEGEVVATVACGGHPPPFLVRGDRAEPVGRPGPLLGAFDDGAWTEQRLSLGAGHSLVLYTDGVTDTRGDGGRFGAERLAALLATVGPLDADEIASRVDQALLDFERGPQRDDVALLVLRASGDDAATASLVGVAAPASG
jgi:PAS domain S-box-containing protein